MIKNLLILIILSLALYSCGSSFGGFDPRSYNNESVSDNIILPPIGPDDGGDVDIPDPENDPFLFDDNNNLDANGFNASKFDSWVLHASFNSANVPTFKFRSGSWSGGDSSKNEYKLGGQSSSAGGNSIASMTYYMYKGKSQLYESSHEYNTGAHAERLERFYFYRFTGKGGGVQPLDNCLVAIDKISKLVFAYAKPTSYSVVLGINVPTSWGPFEKYSSGPGGKRYRFYEYDPVGIVGSDGSVKLFKWYTDRMASGNYEPLMGDFTRPIASSREAGRSPYIPVELTAELEEVSGIITIRAKTFKNIGIADAYFVYSIRSLAYSGFNENRVFDVLAHKNKGEYLWDLTQVDGHAAKLGIGGTINLHRVTPQRYSFYDVIGEIYLELDSRIIKYNRMWSGVWTGKRLITEYEAPIVILRYDRENEALVVDSDNDTLVSEGTIRYDKSFNVKRYETKDFSIFYESSVGDKSEIEIIYSITWS